MSMLIDEVPEFILAAELGLVEPRDRLDADEHLTSWKNMHGYLVELPGTVSSLRIVAYMIRKELGRHPGPRLNVLTRLRGVYRHRRAELEDAYMMRKVYARKHR